jgi:hypothetical protein
VTTTTTKRKAIRRGTRAEREEEERKFFIEKEIELYDPKFRLCREIGHPWIVPEIAYFVEEGEPHRKERCFRCSLTKNRHLVPGGRCWGYNYPEGYHLPGISKQDFRDLSLKQANPVFKSEEALLDALAEAEKAASRKPKKRTSKAA